MILSHDFPFAFIIGYLIIGKFFFFFDKQPENIGIYIEKERVVQNRKAKVHQSTLGVYKKEPR